MLRVGLLGLFLLGNISAGTGPIFLLISLLISISRVSEQWSA